jgi:hypothetical protein
MIRNQKHELATVESIERLRLKDDVRKAEQDWKLAQWRFHNALGDDHVDYAIFGLEAAEKKLDMLLKQAKWQWEHSVTQEESRGMG